MKFVICLVGLLLALSARAELEAKAGWQIGTWVVDSERTLASAQPSGVLPKASIAKAKTYFDSAVLTITDDQIQIFCPADDTRKEIDGKYNYTVTGVVKQKIVLKGRLGPDKIERMVFDFESEDNFSALLKIIPGRLYWIRLKE